MTNTTTPHQEAINRIADAGDKHINGDVDFDYFKLVVQTELEAAYRRGVESIRNSSDYHQREDMGR